MSKLRYLEFLTLTTSAVIASGLRVPFSSPLYDQCGGAGYSGLTTCTEGVCTYRNEWYSECVVESDGGEPTTTTTTPIQTHRTSSSDVPVGDLPTSFEWSSSDVLIRPQNDSYAIAGIKDPSVIYHNGTYHVFASTAKLAGYNLVYLNFTNWNDASSTNFTYLDQTPIGTGYRAAPQIFYFTPQNLWYLVYQNGNAAYSTNPDINNPNDWTAPKTFYNGTPALIEDNLSGGYWVDMWVICDSAHCHLFSSDDNGHLYRSQTTLSNFPSEFSEPVIAMQDLDRKYNLYEASNVYKVNDQYLLIVEAIGSDGKRYFRSWTSPSISGPWVGLADSESNPFARANNVAFNGTAWTKDISHGEMVRTVVDQTMTISPCNMRYLYQGMDPGAGGEYNGLPWRIGLLTQTNSAC